LIKIGQNFWHYHPAFSTTRFSRRQNASKSHNLFNSIWFWALHRWPVVKSYHGCLKKKMWQQGF